jgi:1-acyl-sn-glycerol-3-phosphate acyltransferase
VADSNVKTLLLWLYQIYAWLLFIPFVCLWSLICGWLAIGVAWIAGPRAASTRVGILWARPIGWLTPMRLTVEGSEHIDPQETYVLACNHASLYDIIVLYGWLPLDLRWVMKKEVRKLPALGLAAETVGHIAVDRGDPEAAKRSINEALSRIGDGTGILFFPEGTRSRDGRLLPFKTGAFRVAQDQQLPVLPVTLVGTREILPAGSLRPAPGRVRLTIHPPVRPEGKHMRDLLEETRASIASTLPAERNSGQPGIA